mgnify:CR=1 FL=1|jgi:hypothetical protein
MLKDEQCIYAIMDFETNRLPTVGKDYKDRALPIEVGVVLVNSDLEVLGVYESLITHSNFSSQEQWHDNEKSAFDIHRIPLELIKNQGEFPNKVTDHIDDLVAYHMNSNSLVNKCVMISDNVFFDFYMMQLLWGERKHPFHYAPMCMRMVRQLTGSHQDKAHRALPDAMRIYRELLISLERLSS